MSKNNGKKHGKLYAIITTAAVLLILSGILIIFQSGSSPEIKDSFASIINHVKDFSGEEASEEEIINPKIIIYSQQSGVVEPEKITEKNLKLSGSSERGKASDLYDGDTNTCFECADENTSVTLDAGELKSLDYIKYTPDTASQDLVNSCIGTKFTASKDNENFVELGTILPDLNGELSSGLHYIEFSGYGEFRYFRIEFAPYASLGEVEWICNSGIAADISGRTTIDLMAYGAREDFGGLITLAVYNSDKIIKTVKTVNAEFLVGEYTPIEFTGFQVELGDYIRILTYDRETMEFAAYQPLDYRFTESSSKLYMPNVFSDNMMFQADEDLTLYGKAPRGTYVTAYLTNNDTGEIVKSSASHKNTSDWEINLGSFENGGNYSLKVTDGESVLEYNNITFGDVWVFAGQSNMEFCLCGEKNGEKLLKSIKGKKQAKSSDIRLINMYRMGLGGANGEIDEIPLNDWNEHWTELTPDSAEYISAVSYYFAQELKERFNRNVGIISVAVGDTDINRWCPRGTSNGTFNGDSGNLYNNRIYPFTRLKIKGILWYQGEADHYRTNMNAEQYSDAMACLIDSYRNKWNVSDLPFYYAQITRYETKDGSEIREGQRLALDKVSNKNNVGMIGLLDIIGNYEQGTGCARTDIHPWQKEVVAKRFLNYAARDLYGDETSEVSGPMYLSKEIVRNTVVLNFKHNGSLRIMDSSAYADSVCDSKIDEGGIDVNALHEFKISDETGRFYPANARIENDKVVVWSDEVQNPVDVIYAWGAYPEMPNLTDDSGLPASTFNTAN